MNELNQLLIATRNPAKITEFEKYFKLFLPELSLKNLNDFHINFEPEENGATFEENALIKAREYAKISRCLTLADDGGFEIDALDGQPGVLSRRWPGYEASDEELVSIAMEKLIGVPYENRTAKLRVAVVIVGPDGEIIAKEEGQTGGVIPEKPGLIKIKGFPFRAILFLPQFNKLYQDLSDQEHDKINHRQEIVRMLASRLKQYLNKSFPTDPSKQ
ncbi:MAG: non-canonical purine NTP pyrophosphatase [Patescibacteria group bacterium]